MLYTHVQPRAALGRTDIEYFQWYGKLLHYEMILEILLASPDSFIPKGVNAMLDEGMQCLPAGFAHSSFHLLYSSPS